MGQSKFSEDSANMRTGPDATRWNEIQDLMFGTSTKDSHRSNIPCSTYQTTGTHTGDHTDRDRTYSNFLMIN